MPIGNKCNTPKILLTLTCVMVKIMKKEGSGHLNSRFITGVLKRWLETRFCRGKFWKLSLK